MFGYYFAMRHSALFYVWEIPKLKLFINEYFIHIRREMPKENLTKFYRVVSIYMLLSELNVRYEQKNKQEEWRWQKFVSLEQW
jgi:hypothetical protein